MEKHKKSIAKLMAVLMVFMIFASVPQTVTAATQVVANWTGIDIEQVTDSIYLNHVIHASDGINIGFSDGYLVTSTDLVNWHVRAPDFFIEAELNGRFFGAGGDGENVLLYSTDLRDSWQVAVMPEIDGWISQIINDNGVLRLTYSYWDGENNTWAYMTSPDGNTWTVGDTWVRTENDDAWHPPWFSWEDWQSPLTFPEDISIEIARIPTGDGLISLSYITTQPGAQPQLTRVFHNGTQVSPNPPSGFHSPRNISTTPSFHNVEVNGQAVDLAGFNFFGYNYFRLRDLAYVLNGTSAQFDIETESGEDWFNIIILRGIPYEPVGGEMVPVPGGASASLSDAYVNWRILTAFNIRYNNFFRLRDLEPLIGFEIEWHEATQTVRITTP